MPSFFFPSKSHHRSFIKQHKVFPAEHNHQKTNRSLSIRKNQNPMKYSSVQLDAKNMSKSYDLNTLWSQRSKPTKGRIKTGMKSSKNNKTLQIRGFQKEPSFPNKINTQLPKPREIRTMHTRRLSIDSPYLKRYKQEHSIVFPPQRIFDKSHPRLKATKQTRPFTGWQINDQDFGQPF